MSQPQRTASPSQTAQTPAFHALPTPRPVRPDEPIPELVELICDIIRTDGLADHLAGALAGVPRATLERWKAGSVLFACQLEGARAGFEQGLIRAIKDARTRNGSPDWRAKAWLLTHTSAEGIVNPPRSAKPAPAAAQNRANLPETPAAPRAAAAAPTPTERSAPVAGRENTTNLPETRPPQGAAHSPLTGPIASASKNTTILPETR